jgi:hypothetical protein
MLLSYFTPQMTSVGCAAQACGAIKCAFRKWNFRLAAGSHTDACMTFAVGVSRYNQFN